MASKVEQQYKLLNAELMDQVQKQRIEIGLYKKELIAHKHEIMELREAQILQSARQREDHIGILKSLMLRLDIDAESLAKTSQTMEQETTSEAPFAVSRRSQKRRSSKEICQVLRRSSALASSIKTISPSRLTHTPPPRRVAEIANESPRTVSPTRRRNTIAEKPNEAPELTQHTPPPRRVAEMGNYSSTDDEEEQTNTLTKDQHSVAKEEQRESGGDLITILEDSDETTSLSDTSSPISCDSTVEEYSLPRQVLRSLDPNVLLEGSGMQTRAKGKPKEQTSIQVPRLMVTQASPTMLDSLMSSLSYASEAGTLSPRRSVFEGNMRKSGTNTSTPIPKRSSQPNTTSKKSSEGAARSSRYQPKVRIRKLNPEPREAEQTTDLSTHNSEGSVNSSGRPSRKCRPSQLTEPSLRAKMRNSSVGKKKK